MALKIPTLSVIIPVYNAEQYLRECLDSVINQTLRDVEIICVNDGSPDGSAAILEQYAAMDDRVRVLDKENEGLGAASARNLGYEHATGKYIFFLDSDDFFELDMFDSMVRRAEACDADIVVGDGREYDDVSKKTMKSLHILDPDLLPDKPVFSFKDCPGTIFQITQGQAWNKLFRKSFLEKHNLRFQRIKYTDDAYFTYSHMVLAERIAVVDRILFYYRVNIKGCQSAGITNYPDSAYVPYVALKQSLVEWGLYGEVRQSFINCAAAFMRHCLDKVESFEAYKYLHEKYRAEIFHTLDISGDDKDLYHDKRLYIWVNQVTANSAEEMLFNCTQLLHKGMTTAITRFELPREEIPPESKLVLVGAGLIGRYYYAQIILSNWCKIIMWCDDDNDIEQLNLRPMSDVTKVSYDYVMIALASKQRVAETKQRLLTLGVPETKIICES